MRAIVRIRLAGALSCASTMLTAQQVHSKPVAVPVALRWLGAPPKEAVAVRAIGPSVNLKGVTLMPGTTICKDDLTLRIFMDWFESAGNEQIEDMMTNGQSILVRGKAGEQPSPIRLGCVGVPSGTAMYLEQGNVVPVVEVKLGAVWVRGVTKWWMYARDRNTASNQSQPAAFVPTVQPSTTIQQPTPEMVFKQRAAAIQAQIDQLQGRVETAHSNAQQMAEAFRISKGRNPRAGAENSLLIQADESLKAAKDAKGRGDLDASTHALDKANDALYSLEHDAY